jgi:hypothetical protein
VAIAWGPLYFGLRISEAFEKIPEPVTGNAGAPAVAPAGGVS